MRLPIRLVAAIGLSAAAILMPTIQGHEGTKLVPYKDPVGKWTDCSGNTLNVDPGRVRTPEECAAIDAEAIARHAEGVLHCLPQLAGHDKQIVAFVDLAYNVGVAKFCGSETAGLIRAGKMREACEAITTWCKECYLPGIRKRRDEMRALCLEGLE